MTGDFSNGKVTLSVSERIKLKINKNIFNSVLNELNPQALAMLNLLRDLKSNLLDNKNFRKEFEIILRDSSLTQELRDQLSVLAPE